MNFLDKAKKGHYIGPSVFDNPELRKLIDKYDAEKKALNEQMFKDLFADTGWSDNQPVRDLLMKHLIPRHESCLSPDAEKYHKFLTILKEMV